VRHRSGAYGRIDYAARLQLSLTHRGQSGGSQLESPSESEEQFEEVYAPIGGRRHREGGKVVRGGAVGRP